MMSSEPGSLAARIETIEAGYEFMLAYAAQGRETDDAAAPGPRIREILQGVEQALDGLAGSVPATAELGGFARVLEDDAANAHSAVQFALSQTRISSLLVDNLNASIHIRALLTDLFLIDEAVKTQSNA